MRRGVWLSVGLAIIALAGGGWWFTHGHRQAPPSAPKTQPLPEGIQAHFSKVRIYGVSGGKVIWEVEAENFDLAKNLPVWRFTPLKKAVVLNGKTEELTLTAGALEQNTVTKDITITGDVTLKGHDLLMRTPSAKWDARTEVLRFPETVHISGGDIALTLQGPVDYDVKATTLRCDGDITADIQGNVMQARGAVVNLATQRLELYGPAKATLQVADAESWVAGQDLPEIPPIPESIKARYRAYCAEQQPGGKPGSQSFGKGVLP